MSHAYQEFTLFEIKNPDLTLQLQVAADSINNLFHKCFSLSWTLTLELCDLPRAGTNRQELSDRGF